MSFTTVHKWELAKEEMALLKLTYKLRSDQITVYSIKKEILGAFPSAESLLYFIYGYKSGIMDHNLYTK